jgi:hypothetical protein
MLLSAVLADNYVADSAMPRALLAGTIQQERHTNEGRRMLIVSFSRGPGRLELARFLTSTPGVRYRHGSELNVRYRIDDHHVAFFLSDSDDSRIVHCAGARSLIEAQACWQWFFTRALRPHLSEP